MELVESSLHNWPLAPYDNKLDVDANYKRMVDYGMIPENIHAVHLGIASHNLFELAYAANLAKHFGVSAYTSFEMLEGMADHVRRAIQESAGDMLLYAPVATRDQFINAIAYLIRRLDENTAEENFLRHSFNLKTDSKAWDFLKDQFVKSYHHRKARLQSSQADPEPPDGNISGKNLMAQALFIQMNSPMKPTRTGPLNPAGSGPRPFATNGKRPRTAARS